MARPGKGVWTEPDQRGFLTAVVPAADGPTTLERCLAAIASADEPPEEVIVIDSPCGLSPAACRNAGARRARGSIVVFVDADVLVHADAFSRIRTAFLADPGLTAVFGGYDDRPGAPGTVSAFRNLLHHQIHREAAGPATTFCSALGAIRRDQLLAAGGFDEQRYGHASIEDIELGSRLCDRGGAIVLDPEIAGTHLKVWTLRSMLVTDFLHRGIPWVTLLARRRRGSRALNLGWRHRLSAALTAGTLVGLVWRRRKVAAANFAVVVVLNRSFYRLLLLRQGPRGAAAGVALHALHHMVSLLSVPAGVMAFAVERLGRLHRDGSQAT